MQHLINEALVRQGVPVSVDTSKVANLLEIFHHSTTQYADNPAFSSLGHTISYAELALLAQQFASYLQHHAGLKPGDRIAIQLPNLIQYPVVLFGAMLERAGAGKYFIELSLSALGRLMPSASTSNVPSRRTSSRRPVFGNAGSPGAPPPKSP